MTTPTPAYYMIRTTDDKYARAFPLAGAKEWIVNVDDHVWKIPSSEVEEWFPLDESK